MARKLNKRNGLKIGWISADMKPNAETRSRNTQDIHFSKPKAQSSAKSKNTYHYKTNYDNIPKGNDLDKKRKKPAFSSLPK